MGCLLHHEFEIDSNSPPQTRWAQALINFGNDDVQDPVLDQYLQPIVRPPWFRSHSHAVLQGLSWEPKHLSGMLMVQTTIFD
jgi:hypothetical protein